MLKIFGRTQKLPNNLQNVDFSVFDLDDFIAMMHKKRVFPMAKKESRIKVMERISGVSNG